MARSVLADPDTLNFAMTPENGLPIMAYKGENFIGVVCSTFAQKRTPNSRHIMP